MLDWNKLLSPKRLGLENEKMRQQDVRSQFQRDYDRIIFSSPFRRLQNKTQVFPLPGSIFVHNRLTHSLEVASVGRSLGNMIANGLSERNIDVQPHLLDSIGTIVSSACLAHDLGNPPFGHSGENAISRYFKEIDKNEISSLLTPDQYLDFTNFEGNANTFRLLTHHFSGRRKGGFALTYATIGTLLKYPCTSSDYLANKTPYHKYGVFQSELPILQKVAKELGLETYEGNRCVYGRHPLVFLMEAADDISYQIVDLEDAHRLGIIPTQQAKDLMMAFFDPQIDRDALADLEKSLKEVDDENEQIVILRSRTINKLITDCVNVFWENYDDIMQSKFHASLADALHGTPKRALQTLASLATEKIYNAREVIEIQVAGHRILSELLQEFVTATLRKDSTLYTSQLLRLLPSQLKSSENDGYARIFSVVDFISGMTDVYSLEMYRKIKGISFSVIR
ncbi:MAG: deoxyguanosinetriphosphate triphosphohydrolase [Bacteroidales bacterium]|nr:deoxyguanosinetriphosphate triphosphohydrolase [Bacteroidales bacterium]